MSQGAEHPSNEQVEHFLKAMSGDYPGIMDWYRAKVLPGLNDGSRKLFWRYDSKGGLCALGIAKNDGVESKICTLRVTPQAKGRGIGYHLTDEMLTWLKVSKPHFTISDVNLPKFENWLAYYDFQQHGEIPGLYVPTRKELLFNVKDSRSDGASPTAPSR